MWNRKVKIIQSITCRYRATVEDNIFNQNLICGREMLTISDLNCQDKKLVVYYCKWWEARFQSNGLIHPLVMLSTLEWTPPFHSHLVLTLPLVTLERWSLVVSPFHNNKYRVHEREVLKNSFLVPNTQWTIKKISQRAISTTL